MALTPGDEVQERGEVRDPDGRLVVVTSGAGGGGLTDAELRATPVPVELSATPTIDIGDVTVLNQTQGAGTATNAVRSTLASDDPAVVALQVIDDWDESDRAKVNIISGQAGVAANTGASSATTQRVVAASDSPEVATLGATGDAAASAGGTGSLSAKLRKVTTDTDATATSLAIMDDWDDGSDRARVAGQVAHDAAIAGNPVRAGSRAQSSDITAVSTGDQTDDVATLLGKKVVMPYALPGATWQTATAAKTDTSDTALLAAPGAGIRAYLTSLTVTNSHATVSTVVEVKDGSTVIHRGYALAAGGGYTITFPTPLRCTANTALNVANVTTGSNTYVSASGFTAAE